MMRITIKTENDAFQPYPYAEVARVLRELADKLDPVGMPSNDEVWTLRDINGNTVGTVT